ncbi:MAG: transglutaminase domain-containing protein [Holophagaceae bacterium]|nr:transglutaminase domain-containing protein [Holophagaceae bacterium]
MPASPFLPLLLSSLCLLGQEAPPRTYRLWMGGQEVGGATQTARRDGATEEALDRQWIMLSRLGQEIRQEILQTVRKEPGGALTFSWRLQLSAEPFEGRAEWSPQTPGLLSIRPAHGPSVQKEIPEGALLWPGDLETRLKEAARLGRPVRATTFAFPIQQWNTLQLEHRGPAPLPGFPDAVRFQGLESEGPTTTSVEVWISPTAGEVRHLSKLGGVDTLIQRSELPPPLPIQPATQGIFEWTLQKLPPHPFQPWVPEWTLRAEGAPLDLPEDGQQSRQSGGRWHLRRAPLPTPEEATQPPVKGGPAPEEARYLASTPLVPFQDQAFDGLIRRMALPAGLSRWELARRVNTFVFDWITDKDFSVGFASALEVCRRPRGDCTEHGVLAVALLRRLGVPARGATGWVGLGEMLGLHFWVEVRLGDRWVPIDPTFDQAPASALRIKLGDTDLADLGSVGWDTAATALTGVRWIPEKDAPVSIRGEVVSGPSGTQLRLPKGLWEMEGGVLRLRRSGASGSWRLQAVIRPGEALLKGAVRMAGARSHRQGWWLPEGRLLYVDLGEGRWLQLEGVAEPEAYDLLDQLTALTSSS